MVTVGVKLRTGETFSTQYDVSKDDAKKIMSAPYIEFPYENGWVWVATQDCSIITCAEGEQQPTLDSVLAPEETE
jgi:hypothetical protein